MALLGLLAVAVMVFAYVLTSRLNAASQFVGVDRDHNAKVLARAKQALVGWMAMNAATDNNPGRLPCPQAWGDVGSSNEGRAAGNCSVPAVGWLPWRTLGLERTLDASGNQIWYVISDGWHLPSAGATLSINSDSPGQLALDGQSAVALVIAPGTAVALAPNANQVAAGCAARNQSQVLALPGTPPDPLDFLECQNGSTGDTVFTGSVVDNAVNPVFNDQVLAITAADIMPALEAAVAERMQREIAPALRAVYTNGNPKYLGIPSTSPLYPYAAPWTHPGPGSGTSDYAGQAGTYKGLLPFNQTKGCTASSSNPRCLPHPALITYAVPPGPATKTTSAGTIDNLTCFWESTDDVRVCDGRYWEDTVDEWSPIRVELAARFSNFAMGLRDFDTSGTQLQVYARDDTGGSWLPVTPVTYTATMNSDGSVTVRFGAVLPVINAMSWGSRAEFRLRVERAVIGDHALLDPSNTTTGWFVRNEWFRLAYYATVRRNTAIELSNLGCSTNSSDPSDQRCLRFNDSGVYNIRALLVLAGRSLNDPAARPNSDLRDYVEWQNCDHDPDPSSISDPCVPKTLFEQRPARLSGTPSQALSVPFNDRVILVDWSGSLNSNQIATASPLRTVTLP